MSIETSRRNENVEENKRDDEMVGDENSYESLLEPLYRSREEVS